MSRQCFSHGNYDNVYVDGNIWSKYPGFDRREKGPILPRSCDSVLNDDGCRTQNLPAAREPNGNGCMIKDQINPNDSAIDDSANVVRSEASGVALDISSSPHSIGMEQSFNDFVNDKSWHYQDPSGKVQGPFSMLQLYKWNASGHFPPDLRIWRIDEKQDNSIVLTDALSGKCSKNVSMPNDSQLLSLGASVTLDNKDNSQDGGSNATRNEIHADNQISEQSREQKVDDTSTQSDGKDESVRSNGWHDQPHAYPSQPSAAFTENLKENPSDKLKEGHGTEGNPADNGNHGLNRTSEDQSNSGQSYQKQSYSEENSGQSSEQDWRCPHVNSSSNCVVATSAEVSVTKTSPLKLGFDLHSPPSHPACNPSTWPAFIGEPTDFSSIVDVDESVSDLLAEVEAMESLGGGLESPTSIMKCGEELTDSSKNDCLSFADGLSPVLDAGKGDALSSTGDLHLKPQSTAVEEPLRQADVHQHHQRVSGEHSSSSSEVKVGTKNISVSGFQWESGSENSTLGPSTATWGIATDTTWRLGSENTNLGWGGVDRGNVSMAWGVGQSAVQENRSTSSYTPVVTPNFGGSQTRYGSDRFSVPRDRGFHGHGRESGFGRGRTAWNRQPLFGVGNGGSHRPLPKGQRVCKFYESGHCKKGASCDYLHP